MINQIIAYFRANFPIRLALIYAALSVAWIWTSDYILLLLFQDPQLLIQLSAVKAGGFVLFSAWLLYYLSVREINFRNAAQAKIKQQAELIDEVHDVIIATDLAYNVVSWNKAAERMYGLSAEEAIGTDLRNCYTTHFVSPQTEEKAIETLFETGYWAAIVRQTTRDGRELWVEAHVALVHDAKGNVIGAVAINRDITESHKLRSQVATNEQRFERLVETCWDIILMLDKQGTIQYASPAIERVLGFTVPELVGINATNSSNVVERLTRQDTFRQVLGNPNLPVQKTLRTHRKNGSDCYLEVVATNHLDTEGIHAIVVNARDVTERTVFENHLQAQTRQLNSLHEIAIALNQELDPQRLLSKIINRAVELLRADAGALLLYEEAQNAVVVALTIGDPMPPIGFAFAPGQGISGEILQTKKMVLLENYQDSPYQLPNMKGYPFRGIVAVPIINDDKFLGVLMVLSYKEAFFGTEQAQLLERFAALAAISLNNAQLHKDLSESRTSLSALSQRLLTMQEQERRQIALELHDEIGQVLTAIKLNLRTLMRLNGGALSEYIEPGLEAVVQAINATRDISLNLRPSVLDDLGLAAALRWLASEKLTPQNIKVHLTVPEFPDRLPFLIETTCFRVTQESITNILRHANANEVWINLTFMDYQLLLEIRDDGQGFELAEQLNLARGGQSLGLLSMHERATLAGGELKIDTQPGAGTHIMLTLSLAENPQPTPMETL